MQQYNRRSELTFKTNPTIRQGASSSPRRRAYDGAGFEVEKRHHGSASSVQRGVVMKSRRPRRHKNLFHSIKNQPLRSGMVGIAIAGVATPAAIGRIQQTNSNRVDPNHETTLVATPYLNKALTEETVGEVWQEAKTELREDKINESIQKYRSYSLNRDLAETIYDIALESDIDPDVAFGLVKAESSFKSSATSRVGAIGLTQLMPKTARWLVPGTTTTQLRNPETNLKIGFKYLKDLIKRYDGDTKLALLAYNRGPGTVDRVIKKGGNPDNGYADKVMGIESERAREHERVEDIKSKRAR